MTDEKLERENFEKWAQTRFDSELLPIIWDEDVQGYASPLGGYQEEVQSAWEAWQYKVAHVLAHREEGADELVDAVRVLLDWVPNCSVGSSGYQRIERVKKALAMRNSSSGKP